MKAAFEAFTIPEKTVSDFSELKNAGSDIGSAFETAGNGIGTVFQTIETAGQKALQVTRDLIAALREAASVQVDSSGGGSGGGGGEGFAGGGHVRGPGTSTSDSIPAWLSHNEFVIRAAAVRHWGVDFFRSLNAMRMPQFSAGGLVDSLSSLAMPRFAAGGPVPVLAGASRAGGSPLTLVINGQRIGGLSASGDAVSALKKAAVSGQIFSAGRAPSWVR